MRKQKPLIAIACGGTGGHLFPGLAVGQEFLRRGCDVTVLISAKEVDQQGAKSAVGMSVATLPAVGFSGAHPAKFCAGFLKSFLAANKLFRSRPPQAVLGMGGFMSAPVILAAKTCGAATFLHESNTIPGKANRWLTHFVDQIFVGFPSTASRLANNKATSTGTPVRPQFQQTDMFAGRMALGLHPRQPVLLVMGGSQGASAINALLLETLPFLAESAADLQILHLTGPNDFEKVRTAYATANRKAVVLPFLTEIELALAAATLAISRAGASSLAELAALRLPAILIPYPSAADNHQFYNARALADAGAALLLEQSEATGEKLASLILKLLQDFPAHQAMRDELVRWHSPHAAEQIAEKIVARLKATGNWHRGSEDHASTAAAIRPASARGTALL
jgi:UDP-N-acetylglucosamine--N-acetylmuramyl-(pentapeptide) pyrophosphoryl-undecaprenol N-acetylglucosamine transferase